MRRVRTLLGLPAALILISGTFAPLCAGAGAGAAAAATAPGAATAAPGHRAKAAAGLRPIIFVHGFFGSGSQFQTQAKRFASNGYPPEYIESQEYDTLFLSNSSDDVFKALDARIARLKAATGADQLDLAGHSLGTRMSQDYLNSSAARAANVAHYVNIDGMTATSPPGGVPTLAIWGEGNEGRKVEGATNVYAPDESHVETTTSVATFEALHRFFTGRQPRTTEIVPEPGAIRLGGRAVSFPSNVGLSDARLNVYPIDPATGARTAARPVATFPLSGDGSWGPFRGSGTARYEFEITRQGTDQVHHLYFEPFERTDLGIRLLSTEPGTGVDLLITRNPRHVALLTYRNKEWWGDQGAAGDTLTINGTGVLNAQTTPRSKRAIGIFSFDAWADRRSDASESLGLFGSLPFMTAVDLFLPAAKPAAGTVTLESRQRGGTGRTSRMVVPNWPSDTNTVTVTFDDHLPGGAAAGG